MSKTIKLIQSLHELNTPNSVIKKIYDIISKQEYYGEGIIDLNNSAMVGEITLDNPSYETWIDKINEYFPQLIVHCGYYMIFQDSAVETIMANYLLSKGIGDGNGITYEDASQNIINTLPTSFKENTTVEYFNELPRFLKITSIRSQCFMGCTNLKEIDLSNIIEFAGDQNFRSCTSLQKVILGNINSLPTSSFRSCSNLTTIINFDNLINIESYVFAGCSLLDNIDLSNILTIGNYAFQNCETLSEVDLTKVRSVGNNAFDGDTMLTLKYNTLNSLLTIGNQSFKNTKIATLNATNCTSIGYESFINCGQLSSIDIPLCTSIGHGAFKSCSSLQSLTTGQLSTIDYNAFYGCQLLTTIDLSQCKTIGMAAFYNCKLLGEIDLQNVETIGRNAFEGCTTLTLNNYTLPKVTSLGGSSFSNCKAITSINLPLCTTFGGTEFMGCTALTRADLPEVTTFGNQLTFGGCKNLTNVNSPKVTSIPYACFKECTSLTDLDLSSCTSIGNGGLGGCSSLSNIHCDFSNITSVGESGVSGCTLLTNLDLSNITSIGKAGFYNCKGLTYADLSSCTSIGNEAFSGCSNLTTVILNPNFTSFWPSNQIFKNCGTISIDVSHITNGYFEGAFANTTVTNLSLNQSLTTLSGLSYTTLLSELIIPASITSLQASCFSFAKIPSLKFLSSTPPTAGSSAFHNATIGKIKVPMGSLEAYKNAGGDWNRYSSNTSIWEEYNPNS